MDPCISNCFNFDYNDYNNNKKTTHSKTVEKGFHFNFTVNS